MLLFGTRRLFSLKDCQMCPQNSFLRKYCFFRKNCRIKNIQLLICDKRGYIHFWCKMTLYWSHSDLVAMSQRKKVFLQPLLLRSKIFLFWRNSCARDFIFTFFVFHAVFCQRPETRNSKDYLTVCASDLFLREMQLIA